MGWIAPIVVVIALLCLGATAGQTIASVAKYPRRRRIRDGFVSRLREFRPDIELTEGDLERLLIRTPASLMRFELAELYDAVLNAHPCTHEMEQEICSRYVRILVAAIDSTLPQRVAMEARIGASLALQAA